MDKVIREHNMRAIFSDHWPLKSERDTSAAQTNAPTPSNIAAIDFGTTYSSIVYKTEGDETINYLKLNAIYERVPTAILLQVVDRPQDPHSPVKFTVKEYGMRALTEYSRLRERDRKQYIYFERIKMTLQHDEDVNRNMPIKDFHGDSYYLMEVIAIMLKYLKDQLIDHLSRTARPLRASQFEWVITVPAIWRSRGRHMMREAAYLAGLCSDDAGITALHPATKKGLYKPDFSHEHLTLCLEPEVAAIYCQQITGDQIADYCDEVQPGPNPSTRYMVLDIGGGTVDITAQQIEDGVIEVIDIPTGNDCGGTKVNEQFSHLLQDIVGDPNFDHFLNQNPNSYATHKAVLNQLLYKEFEEEKVKFGEKYINAHTRQYETRTDKEEAKINLHKKFVQFYTPEVIEEGCGRLSRNGEIQYDDDTLYITYSEFEQLFKPAVRGIVDCTLNSLSRLEGRIDTIYLVGGFGGCKYIHGRVKDAIDIKYDAGRYRVVAPTFHKIAVAHGAVLYRCNPEMVRSRKADATYGLSVTVPYRNPPHDPAYLYYDEDGSPVCEYAFLTLVNQSQKVSLGDKYKARLQPISQRQRQFAVPIYSARVASITYFKDKNNKDQATKVGELVISLPDQDFLHKDQRQFEVVLEFSGTEIQAEIMYLDTKMKVKTPIDFLSSHQL